ncbi:hypothetical protein [Adonisia turfae]|nr:hypothetical protein [Adonisia turfae]
MQRTIVIAANSQPTNQSKPVRVPAAVLPQISGVDYLPAKIKRLK